MNNKLIFITSTINHNKFRDRLDAAFVAGYDIIVVGYGRNGGTKIAVSDAADRVTYYIVDSPSRMGIVSRLPFLLKLILKIVYVRIKHGRPGVILVNNAELLLSSSILFPGKTRRIYDLADIHPVQYGGGLFAKLFRAAEARALRSKKWEIVVTSPWFYWNYVLPVLHVASDCYLIENKLIGRDRVGACSSPMRVELNSSLFIGWTGILRCDRSFDILLDLCASNKLVNVDLIGVLGSLDAGLLARAKSLSNIRVLGEYCEEELGDKLIDVHFLWACDFTDGLNSKLLLPNRLYQGVFYRKPLIAAAGTAAGYVVEHYDIGIVLEDFSAVNLSHCLSAVTQEQYDQWVNNCARLSDRVLRGDEWRNFLRVLDQRDSPKLGDEVDVSVVMSR